jgi:SAM-dependent methyltransferase
MDPAAFNAFEAQGWEKVGADYDTFIGRITRRATVPLLDAAQVRPGSRVLDVATGPGHVAAEAAARGAAVTGVDIATAMVELARRHYPQLVFDYGDAQELPFADGSFDAVVANFVILHLGQPERAAAEAARVLAPGGYVSLTTWDLPQRCRLLGVLIEAMAEAGAAPARLLAVGGGVQNRVRAQATSDHTGLDQIVRAQTIGASYGDAFLAALAVGDVARGDIDAWNPEASRIAASPGPTHRRRLARFKRLYAQTRDLMAELSTEP